MMAIIWRNQIKDILTKKGLTVSDLQKKTQMSYPSIHRIASSDVITDDTKIVSLRKIAKALEVSITDLYKEVEE